MKQEKVRVIAGFVEINHEPFAQILPGKDERTLREELLEVSFDELDEARQEAYEEGVAVGEANAESLLEDFNDRIDRFFDKLLADGEITKKQHDIICEGLPCE